MSITLTPRDEVALPQIEALAHSALDTGEGLAGTATATITEGGAYLVTVTIDDEYAQDADYWTTQVRGELDIAARCGLLADAVKVGQ